MNFQIIPQKFKPENWPPVFKWFTRTFYYYLILMSLYVLYVVLKQHNPPPFIYNGF